MNKFLIPVIVVVILLVVVGVLFWQKNNIQVVANPTVLSYKSLTYTIGTQPIKLTDGYSEMEVTPGSVSKIITKYFGNEATGDLNNDSANDVAFLLTQQTGGSGTFYYLAVALKTSAGHQPINTIFLGDRIAPQTTQINGGVITVNYADRGPNEALINKPTIAVSKSFSVKNGSLAKQEIGCTMEAKVCPDGSAVGRTGPNCEFAPCPSPAQAPCYVGGCSGEICSAEQGMMSTCIFKPEYACYKKATCARQNGKCGWTQTAALTECLLHAN